MQRNKNPLNIRVGDMVRINLTRTTPRGDPIFNAKVLEINENSTGDLIVRYQRLDGVAEEYPLCHISFVVRILERAPYVCVPRTRVNRFASEPTVVVRQGGYRAGPLSQLITVALASLAHVDLSRPINIDRAYELYLRAKSPGHVQYRPFIGPTIGPWVHWKPFQRWARRNAARLIEAPGEYETKKRERQRRAKRENDALMEDDMRMMERLEEERELHDCIYDDAIDFA